MNSKVKVHVVDGSECELDCSHDEEEPGPGRPNLRRATEVPSGPLENAKRVWGRWEGTAGEGCRAAWWLTLE